MVERYENATITKRKDFLSVLDSTRPGARLQLASQVKADRSLGRRADG
jgi:hypothetical protein